MSRSKIPTLGQRVARGSVWTFGGAIATSVLGVAINAMLARLLTPAQLGAYFLVFSLVLIGSTLAQFGMERTLIRLISVSIGTGQPGRARAAVRTVFRLTALSAVALATVLILGGGRWLAQDVLRSDLLSGVIVVTSLWLVAYAFMRLLAEAFRGLQQFKYSVLFEALFADVLTAAALVTLWLAQVQLELRDVVVLSFGVTSTAAIIGGFLLRLKVRRLRGGGDVRNGEVLSSSWPLLVSNVTIFLLGTGIDVWILGVRPAQEVALYGAAARLIFFVGVPFTILRSVLPPIVAELYAQGKLKQLEKTVRAVSALAGIPSFIVLVAFLFFGGDILRLLFGGFYQQAAIVLSVLSVGRLVAVWAGACGVVLMMTAYQRTMMYMTVLSGVLSVGAGALLASKFGALGVAVATSSAIVVQNVMMVIAAKRLVGIWTHAKFSSELIRGVVRTLKRN